MSELSDQAFEFLSRSISERLQFLVPDGASPSIAGTVCGKLEALVSRSGAFEDNVASASELILSDVQDQIMRDLHQGWPRSVGGVPGAHDAGKGLPGPGAAVVSGTLRLWYGDSERPALELSPIPLAGLDSER